MDVGFFALTPIWLRLVVLYILVGLVLDLYEEKRAAGDKPLEAMGSILLKAVSAPVTFVRLLIAAAKAPKT